MTTTRTLTACCALALALLAGCRPGDAPKEPAKPSDDPAEPTVSSDAGDRGGVHAGVLRRAQALARI